jgi:hypothetical protein
MMVDATQIGKLLIIIGVLLIVAGAVIVADLRIPWLPRPGRLPGDFTFRHGGTTVYLPLATSLLASVILTVVLSLWRR